MTMKGDGEEVRSEEAVAEDPPSPEPIWYVPPAPVAAPAPAPRNREKRSRTENRITKRSLQIYKEPEDEDVDLEAMRPKTRADCIDGERPCPFVGCKHNLFLDITRTGSITFNFGSKDISEVTADTCALDVAARGNATLDDVGKVYGLTRERIRQIEGKALVRLRAGSLARAVREEHDGEDGFFGQGRTKPRYVPSPRAQVAPSAVSPKPVFLAPEEMQEEEEPLVLPPIEVVEPDQELEVPNDEELEDEPDVQEEPEAPVEEAMSKEKPVKELTDRETSVVDAYKALAKELGAKPSPLAVAVRAGIEGLSKGSISASVCTAYKSIARKGVELPYIDEKPVRGAGMDGASVKVKKSKAKPVKVKKKSKKVPHAPVSEPAHAAEVVQEIPSTAMVSLSSPDAMKNMLMLEKEKHQKALAAIDVLLML